MTWKKSTIDLSHRVSYWTLPPGFNAEFQHLYQRLYQRLHSLNLPPELRQIFSHNKKFHNIHEGKRCFILATGPSINKQDLRPLKNEICIAVSAFYLHKDIKEISPLYHVEAPNHEPLQMEVPKLYFEGYRKYYSEKTTIFLGHTSYEYSYFNFLQQNPEFMKDNIHFLNYTASPALDEHNYKNPDLWDITKPLFRARTVVYCAIQLAIYMGFKEIYLLGCDFDYLSNLSQGRTMHFYPLGDDNLDDFNLWKLNKVTTETFLFEYYVHWKQYRLMQQYLHSRECYIYNSTEGGLLDVFPRVSLEDALANKHIKE